MGARVVVPSELGTGTYTFDMSQESMPLETATYLSDTLYETGLSCALVADDDDARKLEVYVRPVDHVAWLVGGLCHEKKEMLTRGHEGGQQSR